MWMIWWHLRMSLKVVQFAVSLAEAKEAGQLESVLKWRPWVAAQASKDTGAKSFWWGIVLCLIDKALE